MSKAILSLCNIRIAFSQVPLFQDVNAHVFERDRICLVGKNGCGKSTLLKLISSKIAPDAGSIYKDPSLKISYLSQDEPLPLNCEIQNLFENADEFKVDSILGRLKIKGDTLTNNLSGGEKRRVLLAKCLIQESTLLLLDEPTNHLDIETIEWLEDYIARFKGAVITISHDRRFLEKISKQLWWMKGNTLLAHDKGFDDFERFEEEYLARLENQSQKLNTKLRQEMHWLHRGVTARRKRNQGRLARLKELRATKKNQITQKALSFGAPCGNLGAKLVVECDNITKKFHDKPLFAPFSTRIIRGERIGIIGPNGSGKTTLVRMLLGETPPDQGTISKGSSVHFVYIDQMKNALMTCNTPIDFLCPTGGDQVIINGTSQHVIGYLKDFLFEEFQIKGKISLLSGGEKNRLMIAKALCEEGGNVLVLDEPTNDLDMETLDLLEEMLSDYHGTLIVISHDRDFLNRLTTSIIAIEHGKVNEYAGGYDDYLKSVKEGSNSIADKNKKLASSVPPKRKEPLEKARMTYLEKKEWDNLQKEIPMRENEIKELEKQLGAPVAEDELSILLENFAKKTKELETLEQRFFELMEKDL